MSTNINLEALEQLANQFFRSLPGEPVPVAPLPAVAPPEDPLLHPGNGVNLAHPQTSFPDPHVSGKGVSPGYSQSPAQPGLATGLPGRINDGIPASIAGSGVSPTLPYQYDHVLDHLLPYVRQEYIPSQQVPVQPGPFYYFLAGQQALARPPFDVQLIKQDFPILQQRVNGRPLTWLDNAATTQKPKQVIDRIKYFYEYENSNIHRAAHTLAARATDAYEGARNKVQHFINARSPDEIVFVRGATEAINLVAKSWGEQFLEPGDEIIVSHLEHHANIVPWQQLVQKKGLKLQVIPVDEDGQVILEAYSRLLNSRTKLVSFTQVSNALGTITPAQQIVSLAHAAGAKVLVDGAQSVSHMKVDVQQLDADWFVFSGHKVFGPTGIGVLYGKEALLNETAPWQGGGNMISDVTFAHTQYHVAPARFEAGTGNIADAVGLGAALDYVGKIGIDHIYQYEHALLQYGTRLLQEVPGLRLIGTASEKASVLSFVLRGFRTEEVGEALSAEGIAVRSGHHCAQPILRRFGVESTVRPSLAFYNTCADIDLLVHVLHQLVQRKRS
ncbi:cysteine desulfurase [Chitinophaga pendula]|uniref:family 2A encapsulin nanocompartment cargo protein cysteine desulfurase n=1 Tax=Chitinophaga TaxID=79328 RepID=UPI000BAF1623|nr:MULTISPECIES: family 2A encapsulin nanocompartment cargo protein cysteine desulfurase [Chitinophaga]ASZ10918.1 segregation protein B [Chitinophaga sp. MD30]UCJ06094.1 cysteine desulfurase [Chitinophaga pendula]